MGDFSSTSTSTLSVEMAKFVMNIYVGDRILVSVVCSF